MQRGQCEEMLMEEVDDIRMRCSRAAAAAGSPHRDPPTAACALHQGEGLPSQVHHSDQSKYQQTQSKYQQTQS